MIFDPLKALREIDEMISDNRPLHEIEALIIEFEKSRLARIQELAKSFDQCFSRF